MTPYASALPRTLATASLSPPAAPSELDEGTTRASPPPEIWLGDTTLYVSVLPQHPPLSPH
eukprot:2636787-Heterocapsa_arctica.AAC.1